LPTQRKTLTQPQPVTHLHLRLHLQGLPASTAARESARCWVGACCPPQRAPHQPLPVVFCSHDRRCGLRLFRHFRERINERNEGVPSG
jgi:hypothetical protein